MLFSWFELLLLVAVVQGTITGVLLMKAGRSGLQNRLLGLMLLCFTALCSKMAMYSMGLDNVYPWLQHMPLAFETAIPPLAYLYCLSLTQSGFKLTKAQALHFLPFAFFMLHAIGVYAHVLLAHSGPAKDAVRVAYHLLAVKEIEDYWTALSIGVYLGLSAVLLKNYRNEVNNFTSDNGHAVFTWLRSIQVLMGILLAFLVLNMVMDKTVLQQAETRVHWKIYFLYLAAVLYYLGFKAHTTPVEMAGQARPARRGHAANNDALPADKAQALAARIAKKIEQEALYLNPTFSIRELSEILQVNQSTVSQVINRCLGVSFRDLINQHRIDRAKKQLLLNQGTHLSVLAQALECGFNSEASFYRVFKKHTGQSPTQYIKSAKINSAAK